MARKNRRITGKKLKQDVRSLRKRRALKADARRRATRRREDTAVLGMAEKVTERATWRPATEGKAGKSFRNARRGLLRRGLMNEDVLFFVDVDF